MCVACRLEKTLNPYAPTPHDTDLPDDTGFGIPGDPSTGATISLGTPVYGSIDYDFDTDWYGITLQAGVTYSVALTGGSVVPGLTLTDPVLGIYNQFGSFVTGNDDGSVGLDSFLTFTASYTGTYYLEAASYYLPAYYPPTGTYELLIAQVGGGGGGTGGTDDFAGNATTTGSVTIGGSVTGELEQGGDTDWFALTLAAGDSVLVTLTGNTLNDPYLTLYDAQGNVLTQNDDYQGLNSGLVYTADTAQTVYIEAAGYDAGQTGTYTVAVDTYVPQPYDPLDTIDWGTQMADTTVTYYFAPAGVSADGYTSEGFNAYEQSRFEAVFELISQSTGLTFTEVSSQAAADFVMLLDLNEVSGQFLGYFNPPGEPNEGVGVFDGTQWDRFAGGDLEEGGYGMVTMTHEVLHGLGLAHPHDTGGSSSVMGGVFGPYDQYGDHELNQGVFTTMTYNTGYFTGTPGSQGDTAGQWGFEVGPMALDIAVLQRNYGVNDWWRGDDDTYLLPDANLDGTGWRAIWDTAGVDTLRYDGDRNVVIDLREATLEDEIGGGGFISAANGVAGGYTIAAGALIENATAGSGDDQLLGNDGDNTLQGGAGNDTLRGRGGTDTAVIGVNQAQVSNVTALVGGVQIVSFDGIDELFGIEYVQFRDATVTVSALLAGSDPDASGGAGSVLTGTGGPETLAGTSGDDSINARAGSDRIEAGEGWDDVTGAVGADTILGEAGHDTLRGVNGFDSLDGGTGDDVLEGNFGNDTLLGGEGNDSLNGGLGFDLMEGGRGDDLLAALDGYDTLLGGAGADTLEGNNGNDSLDGGADDDRLEGGFGADTLEGGTGDDFLFGGNGFDNLTGGSGADRLEGNAGNDTLAGGAGTDVLKGGVGADTFVFTRGDGADRIADFQNAIDTIQIDADLLGGGSPVATDLIGFAGRDANGFLILDFGFGDTLTFTGVTNTGAILDEVVFI